MIIASSYELVGYGISLFLCASAFLAMGGRGRLILTAAVFLVYAVPSLVDLPISHILLIILRVSLGVGAYLFLKIQHSTLT